MIRKCLILTVLQLCAVLAQGCGGSLDPDVPEEKGKTEETTDWNDAAEKAAQSLILHYWNSGKGYFNFDKDKADGPDKDWSYWPEAHAMDIIVDGFIRTGGANSYKYYYDKWYEGVKQKSGGSYYNNYYDDMEWICLTMIRLYETSREAKYLDTAKDLWNDIKTGWNTQYAGGGVAWKKDQPWSKNACSNGPAGIIAARLYEIGKDTADLEWARKIFDWEYDHLYEPSQGRIYDNVDGRTGTVTNWVFTYNQGTFMGLAHELYKHTGERSYLNIAAKAASFTISNDSMVREGILKDEGTGDGGLFKGVFIRYFVKLALDGNLSDGDRKKFSRFLDNNAKALWKNGTADPEDPVFGCDWSRSDSATDLGTQVSGCALLEARALYEKANKNTNN